ncbi:hypothetical protein TRVL_09975 [Trypanosoma vivax]|nr:hypothetical protein TRVL_09975 [Trypanosoma vivax]
MLPLFAHSQSCVVSHIPEFLLGFNDVLSSLPCSYPTNITDNVFQTRAIELRGTVSDASNVPVTVHTAAEFSLVFVALWAMQTQRQVVLHVFRPPSLLFHSQAIMY